MTMASVSGTVVLVRSTDKETIMIDTIERHVAATRPGRDKLIDKVADLLSRYSIDILRVSLGLVFLGFGALKFVPGLSPAQDLAVDTLDVLTLGFLSGSTALVATAAIECFIGVTLVTGRMLKAGLVVLAAALVGIMSPLVLFFPELFSGGPTLEAQYVLKDIVLGAAGLVIGAKAVGARLTHD